MSNYRNQYGVFEALVEAFDGQTHWFDQGYHASFRFWLAKTDRGHPYRYELVLHDPEGKRIMGYDNAHLDQVEVRPIHATKRKPRPLPQRQVR